MLPLRRTLDSPWNSLIARYGPTGTEESFLDRAPPSLNDSIADTRDYRLEEVPESVAPRRGSSRRRRPRRPCFGATGAANGEARGTEGLRTQAVIDVA
jgi:hypothetical protein